MLLIYDSEIKKLIMAAKIYEIYRVNIMKARKLKKIYSMKRVHREIGGFAVTYKKF